MKERPILFSGPMVRAILEGRKTQTRRVVKFSPASQIEEMDQGDPWPMFEADDGHFHKQPCKFGEPGDWLWVRETWASNSMRKGEVFYGADEKDFGVRWRPSIHMPRWACRITLEVTGVRVERLNKISEEDAIAEGIQKTDNPGLQNWPWLGPDHKIKGTPTVHARPSIAFRYLWDSINEERAPWSSNPWVWVIEFKRVGAHGPA